MSGNIAPDLSPGRIDIDAHQGDPAACTQAEAVPLHLMSYNIHAGIAINKYRHYLTHSWKHLLPYRKRGENLDRIASMAARFDVVGLQETDSGSIRSEFINQVDYLAEGGGFPYRYHQTNRRLGKIAQHSMGLLSRLPILEVDEHKLPGAIPGRGTLVARLEYGRRPLVLMIVHLALGRRARLRQINYISAMVRRHENVVIMGDLNFRSESGEMAHLLRRSGLREPIHGLHTFPSWRPHRNIDHILVSPSLQVRKAEVIECQYSDHLPVAAQVSLRDDHAAPVLTPARA